MDSSGTLNRFIRNHLSQSICLLHNTFASAHCEGMTFHSNPPPNKAAALDFLVPKNHTIKPTHNRHNRIIRDEGSRRGVCI